MTLTVFLIMMGIFLAVGIASVRSSTGTREDYYLASQSIGPAFAGLSAVATNNSGYMFIGVIGFTYRHGLSSIWLMLGWIMGDWLASLFVHRHLRDVTTSSGEPSYIGVLARSGGLGDFSLWRRVGALLAIVFLGVYAAAQIRAGSKALHGVLGWDPALGAILVAAVVLIYSTAGGIRASIWTDVAQSGVMLGAMALLGITATLAAGGPASAIDRMAAIPGFLDWSPAGLPIPGAIGFAGFLLGWLFAGISVIGQPHVMIRFMALGDAGQLRATRYWYYGYFALFYLLATGVGMLSRLHLPQLAEQDPELALPMMSLALLHPSLVGVVLAGIFAATMSTADSLVLACSAALTHDLPTRRLERIWQIKGATAFVATFALAIALFGNHSVFDLVILSWSTLACAFGPLLVLHALGRRITEPVALAMLIVGIGVAWAWRSMGWHDAVYEGLPGMLAGLAVGIIPSLSTRIRISS